MGDSHALSLTWFENEIENLIVDPFGALPYNTSGKGNANGLELGFEGHALDQTLRYGLAYTYLDRSLVGLPENVIDAHLHWEATDQLDLGLGIAFVDDRDLGGDALDEYVTARIYGSYAFNDHLSLHARLENAFDERYEHASFGGVPVAARRLGAFAGLTLKW